MRNSLLIPMAALTLALSVASTQPAAAQDRYGRYDDRYNDRYDDRYGNDSRYDTRNVAAVAHEIEQTAYSIRREAERNNRRPDRREAQMLYALRDLNQQASEFHAQVEGRGYGYGRGSGRSSREFDQLVRSFQQTGNILDRVAPRPYVDRGMERIGYLLSQVSRYYGQRGDYRYDRNGHGRDYDRDGRWDGYQH